MAKKKSVTVEEPVRELVKLDDDISILMLCRRMTNLKLDSACHMDKAYARQWYETRYLAGIQCRYVMKNGLSINHIRDGVVYRAFNTTDEIAERLMMENPAYKDYFEDLGPFAVPQPEQTEEPAIDEGMQVEPETPEGEVEPQREGEVEPQPEEPAGEPVEDVKQDQEKTDATPEVEGGEVAEEDPLKEFEV